MPRFLILPRETDTSGKTNAKLVECKKQYISPQKMINKDALKKQVKVERREMNRQKLDSHFNNIFIFPQLCETKTTPSSGS